MEIEAILLTGGASRRMGRDKASIEVDGVPMAQRIARELFSLGIPVTAAGRAPLEGCEFLPDAEEYAGPMAALARFRPERRFVMVVSCDLPAFHGGVVLRLREILRGYDAAVPMRDGRLQPLCALYRAEALETLHRLVEGGERRIMRWLQGLDLAVTWTERCGLAEAAKNANTPEDLMSA
jgi:molybdenum cofactor guanylyltransferase